MTRLRRLFAPKSVAVFGGRVAESVVIELKKLGFEGDIWPINPNRAEMDGVPCLTSIADLPSAPDVAYIAVPNTNTIEIVRTLSDMDAGGVICHASGFSEMGAEGKYRTDELLCAANDMPLLGPNCWGLLNLIDNAALWPDFHGCISVESGVAIISQSGNMAINITMQRRGLPIAYVVNLGNQAMLDANDCIEAFLDDARVSAIGVHMEGLKDVARFSEIALRAHKQGTPIVVFKAGSSAKGARATVSHTSTLAGSDNLYDALFTRCGVARARSVPGFLETLKLLSLTGPLPGNKIASLSCSGGEASLIADRAEHRALTFPDLTPDHTDKVRATLNEYVDVTNPLDYHTFIWGQHEQLEATYGSMMEGQFDMAVLVQDYPREDRSKTGDYEISMAAWIAAAHKTNARAGIIATMSECMPERVAEHLYTQGVMPFSGMEEALDAMEAAALIGDAAGAPIKSASIVPANIMTLDEVSSKALLSEYGLAVPSAQVVPCAEAATVAKKIGFPVVLKAVGDHLAHKTEAGGVKLNLKTEDEVFHAAAELNKLSDTVLVEKFINDGIAELIVGIGRDDQFGPYLVLGAGGILVELLEDNAALLLPTNEGEIEAALRGLKIFPLLKGYRGKSAGDIPATIAAIKSISEFALAHWATLAELDVNPLIVRPEGKGVTVADALIRLGETQGT
ncbi:MAG: acetate--CoA ligase family protein [Hyphomicrobiales bacterium]